MKKKHHKKGLNIDKFNKMIDAAAAIVVCDSTCERTKQQEALKKKFTDAQANLHTAPDQLNLASKQYFAFSNGKTKYEEITEQELTKKAKMISTEIANNFLGEVDQSQQSLQTYSADLRDAKMAKEYNNLLIKQIRELQNILYDLINGTVTNNRKSYYEDESTSNLRSWNYVFMVIFYVLTIAISASFFLAPNTLTKPKKIGIIVTLVFYPFYIMYIANIVMRLYNSVASVFPKNVYGNI